MPTAYLTVDDAPSDELPEKLSLLRERDVPALFFCEGRRLADHADRARRAVEAGFHLGNHAYSHTHASELTVEEFREEVERTESLLEGVYDRAGATRPAKAFRFPYGDKGDERAERFQRVLGELGFEPPDPDPIAYEWYGERHGGDRDWFWTIDVEDWAVESAAALRENVDSAADRLDRPSADIVLFHDAGNDPALFEAFLDDLLDRGVAFRDPVELLS